MPYKDSEERRVHQAAYNAAHREEVNASNRASRAEHLEARRAKEAAYSAAHREERKASSAAYYAAHREELGAHQAAYAAATRERRKVYNAAYRAAHLEELRAKEAAYNAAHREEKRVVTASWRAADPERNKASKAAYAVAHPETARAYHAAHQTEYHDYQQKAEAIRRGAPTCDHPSCLAIEPAALAWQVYPHVCYICSTAVWERVNLHFDHVVPVVRGGVHCVDNLRPTCASCNHRKHAKTLQEFLKASPQVLRGEG